MNGVDLVEWGTGFLQDATVNFDERSQRIADQLASNGRLEILQLRSGIRVRATSWVGRITLGDLTITVRPKVSGAPLVNLLRYAYSLRDLQTFTPTGFDTTTQAFQDVLVEQLANEAAELLSRGLHRDYLQFNAELPSPRGRIDFEDVAHTLAAPKPSIACTYYNRSEAILLNRVVLAGLQLAVRLGTDSRLTATVFRLAQSFEASVPTMRLTRVHLESARRAIDRRSTPYSSALTLIELLFDGQGVSIADPADSVQMPGFLFDMNRFFQSLISRFLGEELRECSIQDERRLKHMFEYVPGHNPKHRRALVPRPDFAVLRRGKVVEFLDAKYKDLWETSLPRDMLYQLTIYALAKDTGLPRSTILYPTLADRAADQLLWFKDPALGHQRAEIVLRPVNLLEMERLVQPRRSGLAARQRREYAWALVFGNRRDVYIRAI